MFVSLFFCETKAKYSEKVSYFFKQRNNGKDGKLGKCLFSGHSRVSGKCMYMEKFKSDMRRTRNNLVLSTEYICKLATVKSFYSWRCERRPLMHHWRSDAELTLDTLALDTLYGGQFTFIYQLCWWNPIVFSYPHWRSNIISLEI